MIKVQAGLCIGCGRCADGCPQRAISIINGKARINQPRCTACGLCRELCPQGAIIELSAVSGEKLSITIGSLKEKTDVLIERIEQLRSKSAR